MKDVGRQAKHPAAWINAVYEARNFDEAIGYLQKTWDDLRDAEIENERLRARLAEAERDAARYRLLREIANADKGDCPICGYDGLKFTDGYSLDAFLDAAMAGDKP